MKEYERSFNTVLRAHDSGAPASELTPLLQRALVELRASVEEGTKLHPRDLWTYFHASVAVQDRPIAHFLSSLGKESWEPTGPEWNWLVTQVRVAFALFRRDEDKAKRWLEDLRTYSFDEPLGEEFIHERYRIQATYHLLESIHQRDEKTFQREMLERKARCLDLAGLGLSRLARDRSIAYKVQSSSLPLDVLEQR